MATALRSHGPWVLVGILGAIAFAIVATARGEQVNALWIVVAAIAVYLIAYRYYSLYIARNVMQLDPARPTPAVRHNDGLDYVPTNKYVLYGHHFAAIAGAGPLVGPVLAAQMGYLPGMMWILAGVVLAGAVQDFMVLFVSMRRDGRSLGELIRAELGPVPGVIALFGAFLIMIIILAQPTMQMPALTRFVDGTGPVWSGPLFPFLFITIACGAVSGFHALIASGTTPKLIATEADARFIGYGGMLMESFVAIMALVAASIIDPGVYFTMNSPAAVVGTTPESAAAAVTAMGFPATPELITATAQDVGETTII